MSPLALQGVSDLNPRPHQLAMVTDIVPAATALTRIDPARRSAWRPSAQLSPNPMTALVLEHRRSTPSRLLGEPGPSGSQLLEMLRVASRVPDHGALAPFRFLRVTGDARAQLGDRLAARKLELEPDCDASVLAKERGRFVAAPVVVTVIGCYQAPHKIPVIEQQLTAGCVCFSLLQTAQAMGFGAQWLTAWAAYDPIIAGHLGLSNSEAVVGFIHIGTAREEIKERPRPDVLERLQDWQP